MRLYITKDGEVRTALGIQSLRKGGQIVKRTKSSITVQWPAQEPTVFQNSLPAMNETYKVADRDYNPRSGQETFHKATSANSRSREIEPVGTGMSRKRGRQAKPLTQESINKRRR